MRRNNRIRASEVRVIAPDGVQLGVMRTADAISRALELGLDLVEVAPSEHPPICRIMDFWQNFRDRSDEPPNRHDAGAN
jgi:translation initiation factor IF-3